MGKTLAKEAFFPTMAKHSKIMQNKSCKQEGKEGP